MEQTPNQNYLSNDLTLDAVANAHLKETAMWGKFLGITGMVVSVLFIFFGFFAGAFFSKLSEMPGTGANPFAEMGVGILSGIYIVMGIISLILSWIMYKFGNKTQLGLKTNDQTTMDTGLANLKILFRIYGIIVIIYLGFVALALLFSIIGTMMN